MATDVNVNRLAKVVETVYEDNQRNVVDTIDCLIAMARTGEGLREAFLRRGVTDAVHSVIRNLRVLVVREVAPAKQQFHKKKKKPRTHSDEEIARAKAGIHDVAARSYSFLRDWMLPGGCPLGLARRSDLQKAAASWERTADGCNRNARFVRLVEMQLAGNENLTVSQVLTEKMLEDLRRQADSGS